MAGNFARFTGNIPEHYDNGLGPNIFVDYAQQLARRVAQGNPARILETAAGTGIVTRRLRDTVAASTRITATDLNEAMLDVARRKFRPDESIEFQPADATDLPFDDGSFDAVVCQFGIMFFPDRDAAYREVYRTLSPGGRYHLSVWDSFDHNPFARIAHETISGFFPSDPPGFYQVPFSCHDPAPIVEALTATGFDSIETTVTSIDQDIPNAEQFARGIIYGNPVFDEIQTRANADPHDVMVAVTNALRREFGDDPGRMPLQAIFIEGAKPV